MGPKMLQQLHFEFPINLKLYFHDQLSNAPAGTFDKRNLFCCCYCCC